MSKLIPGSWKGILADWGVTKSKSGTPGVVCSFSISCGDDLVTSDKILYLTDKTKERTIETLYKLGFNGKLEDVSAGRPKNALEGGKEVILQCENEVYEGETKCRIQWINLPGESHGVTKVDAKEGSSLLDSFKADFLSLKPAGAGKKKAGLDLT